MQYNGLNKLKVLHIHHESIQKMIRGVVWFTLYLFCIKFPIHVFHFESIFYAASFSALEHILCCIIERSRAYLPL